LPSRNDPLADALLSSIRRHQTYRERTGVIALFIRKMARVQYEILSILTGSDIDVRARFGLNLRLPHPNGVIIHGDVVIGDDCMLMQQVTLGQLAENGVPALGSRIYVGSGAKVLGPVRIGDGAQIGANAVVLKDVPAGATAVGVPAVVVKVRP
jgi:serine O-acetyltransferase